MLIELYTGTDADGSVGSSLVDLIVLHVVWLVLNYTNFLGCCLFRVCVCVFLCDCVGSE